MSVKPLRRSSGMAGEFWKSPASPINSRIKQAAGFGCIFHDIKGVGVREPCPDGWPGLQDRDETAPNPAAITPPQEKGGYHDLRNPHLPLSAGPTAGAFEAI